MAPGATQQKKTQGKARQWKGGKGRVLGAQVVGDVESKTSIGRSQILSQQPCVHPALWHLLYPSLLQINSTVALAALNAGSCPIRLLTEVVGGGWWFFKRVPPVKWKGSLRPARVIESFLHLRNQQPSHNQSIPPHPQPRYLPLLFKYFQIPTAFTPFLYLKKAECHSSLDHRNSPRKQSDPHPRTIYDSSKTSSEHLIQLLSIWVSTISQSTFAAFVSKSESMLTRNSKTEFDSAIKDNNVVVLDAFATWCGPCKVIAPQVVK